MIDLEGYITSTLAGARPKVDWNEPPWAGAQAALHWLGVAPAPTGGTYEPLSSADAERLSDRMLRTFVDAGQGLAWSSARLETAAGTIAAAVQGPPEPFLRSAWRLLGGSPLDRRCYEFCREIGRTILANYRTSPNWDLTWMTHSATPSQACLRYWTIGVRPRLWGQELEQVTMRLLKEYPYQF